MTKLRKTFSKKQWKNCCTGFCDSCEIASAYKKEYGKKQGLKRLKKDKEKILKE